MGLLKFRGSNSFRLRLLLATLSGRSIRIDDIRSNDASPGLRDFEASFLRLMEKLTNGCVVEINETGTSLKYKPGVIVGGSGLFHDCGLSRSIGWFIEPLITLALFGKRPLSITLRGLTNDHLDPSVDVIRTVTLPLLKRIGIEDNGLELKVFRRGARPLGGGEVMLKVPIMKQLPPVNLVDEGMVKRIRGVAYSMKVSPQSTNRMVDGARGPLNDYLADVFIFTDAVSGASSGNSPGFGVTLVAETTSGCLISAEACAKQDHSKSGSSLENGMAESGGGDSTLIVPEDVGSVASAALLQEIKRGGVVDGSHQGLLLLLAALGPQELAQVRLGPLTPHAVRTLRHIKDFLAVQFDLEPEEDTRTIFGTCIGSGLRNLARKTD